MIEGDNSPPRVIRRKVRSVDSPQSSPSPTSNVVEPPEETQNYGDPIVLWHVLAGDFIKKLVDCCRQRRCRFVWVVAADDPDSLCSVAMMQSCLATRLSLELTLSAVSSMGEFASSLTKSDEAKATLDQSAAVVFLGVGARHDLKLLLRKHVSPDNLPQVFVIDGHRPLSRSYFYRDTGNIDVPTSIVSVDEEPFPGSTDVPRTGEYLEYCVSSVFWVALKGEGLDTHLGLLAVAVGAAFQWQVRALQSVEFCRVMRGLKDDLRDLKRRYNREIHGLDQLKFEDEEICIPLLRFSTACDSIKHSVLFLRHHGRSFAGRQEIERGLAAIRVGLELTGKSWSDPFRVIPPLEQKAVTRTKLPSCAALYEALRLMTLACRA